MQIKYNLFIFHSTPIISVTISKIICICICLVRLRTDPCLCLQIRNWSHFWNVAMWENGINVMTNADRKCWNIETWNWIFSIQQRSVIKDSLSARLKHFFLIISQFWVWVVLFFCSLCLLKHHQRDLKPLQYHWFENFLRILVVQTLHGHLYSLSIFHGK